MAAPLELDATGRLVAPELPPARLFIGGRWRDGAGLDEIPNPATGQATLVAPGVLSIAETGVITGGTGRFAGATGSFTGDRKFFIATGVTTGSFTGTVSSPGSS